MTRNIVRTVTVLAGAACLAGTQCPAETMLGPSGLIPAGDYRLTRPTADTRWLVPAPAPHRGCATLVDARFVFDADGRVVHTRTLTQAQNGENVVIQQELRPELSAVEGSSHVRLYYGGGWFESGLLQRESTATNPDGTALYVDQFFGGEADCAQSRLMLRYSTHGIIG